MTRKSGTERPGAVPFFTTRNQALSSQVNHYRIVRQNGGAGLRCISQPGRRHLMTTERAVLAGGFFRGMQDLIRKLDG